MGEPKRVLLEFIGGGDWDGKILDSQSQDPIEAKFALHYYDLTHQGKVGHAFYGVSMGQVERMIRDGLPPCHVKLEKGKAHKYEVVERLQEGEEILVRIKYSIWESEKRSGGTPKA